MRAETMSRTLRDRFFYKVPVAGSKVGMSRYESYEAARAGQIPTERDGRLMLVLMAPGAMALTRIRSGATSWARLRINKLTPPLEAA